MNIALIKPPLQGHTNRGVGQYTQLLYANLLKTAKERISLIPYAEVTDAYDLVHFPFFDPYFLTLPSKFMQPAVVTIHDMILLKYQDKFPPGIKGKLKWLIQRSRVSKANAIITDSKASQSDIAKYISINKEKIHSIYLAPDPIFNMRVSIKDKESIRKKYKLPQKFILFVGEPNWNKNLVQAIKATQKIKCPLVVVSKTFAHYTQSSHAELQYAQEANSSIVMPEFIYKLSSLEKLELVTLYQMAAALVYPSFDEGFGLPVLEAYASLCPVITTKRGSLREVAGDAALFVDPNDYAVLAEHINKILIDTKLRRKLVQQANKHLEKFSWEKTAAETLQVYKQVYYEEHGYL